MWLRKFKLILVIEVNHVSIESYKGEVNYTGCDTSYTMRVSVPRLSDLLRRVQTTE